MNAGLSFAHIKWHCSGIPLMGVQIHVSATAAAKAFLSSNQATFINDHGESQKLFIAMDQQVFRPEMFADIANPAFYKQFAQSGISRDLTNGIAKELKDSGVDLKNGAVDLLKAAKDNPGAVVEGVWNVIKGLPQSVVNGFIETGTAIGEGAAVALNPELTDKLNAIYGTDTAGLQKAVLAIRMVTAVTGATGTAKAGTQMGKATAEAVGKKLDEVLDQKVVDALLKSGGVVDIDGRAVLDMKQLTTQQKGVAGELFGAHTVQQIVPDGEKLARIPGVGETGIDDLYKVNRPDVDYVIIEYKFVGTDGKTGAQALGKTGDGVQGSESWILGGDRLVKAVGRKNAADVELAFKGGRAEAWVVVTRLDGSTEIQVLDAYGKAKTPTMDASKLLSPSTNVSGTKP